MSTISYIFQNYLESCRSFIDESYHSETRSIFAVVFSPDQSWPAHGHSLEGAAAGEALGPAQDDLPEWEVARQVPPDAAGSQHVENRIDQPAQRPAAWGRRRKERPRDRPFGIG